MAEQKKKIKTNEINEIAHEGPKNSQLPATTAPKLKMFLHDGSFNDELFFELMGNDIRRKILSKLAKFPRYASDLAIDLGVSKQAIKKHLDRLVGFGFVNLARSEDQKKQYYQISPDIAIFAQIDLTPNYFALNVRNNPEQLTIEFEDIMHHNPQTAMTTSRKAKIDYKNLNYSLKILGSQLNETEKKIRDIEKQRQKVLLRKTILLNRIQIIINSLVESDLEKEVIFSLFFDTNSTIQGLTLDEILNQLFLRKRRRAGVGKYKYIHPNSRTLERGQKLLDLIKMLIDNFGFIRTEDMKLFFDFD